MTSSLDTVEFEAFKSIVRQIVNNTTLANRHLQRGLIAALTSIALILLLVLSAGSQQEVLVPVINIKLPLHIASVAFWIGSFVLGLSAALRYREAVRSSLQVGKQLGSLSDDERARYLEYYFSLDRENSLLMKPPGVLLLCLVPILHAPSAGIFSGLLFCWNDPYCADNTLRIGGLIGMATSATPYLYLAVKCLKNWVVAMELNQAA